VWNPPTTRPRALRELVVQRKIMGMLRNGKGAHIYETLMSLLETARARPTEALSESLSKAWMRNTIKS
jgi:hypothetical protein